jgi:hypothetical protein
VGAGVGPVHAPACQARAPESVLHRRKSASRSGVDVVAGPTGRQAVEGV